MRKGDEFPHDLTKRGNRRAEEMVKSGQEHFLLLKKDLGSVPRIHLVAHCHL